MMWEYVRFEDDTQVSCSEVRDDNTVLVVERPRDWGFDTAECLLPAYNWQRFDGFSEKEAADLGAFVRNNSSLIMRFAYKGGRVLRRARARGRGSDLLLSPGAYY